MCPEETAPDYSSDIIRLKGEEVMNLQCMPIDYG
jgi:hypothetical protein